MTTGLFILNALKMAVLSDDRLHRYWLVRIWTRSLPILVVCMFNPSTANERDDDPTIKKLCAWAKRWGYGGILVVNLYSLRSSTPDAVRGNERKAWGDAQPAALGEALAIAAKQGTPVLVAWGNLASEFDAKPFYAAAEGLPFICLGFTHSGAPKHPMARGRHRIPDDQQPLPYCPAV